MMVESKKKAVLLETLLEPAEICIEQVLLAMDCRRRSYCILLLTLSPVDMWTRPGAPVFSKNLSCVLIASSAAHLSVAHVWLPFIEPA